MDISKNFISYGWNRADANNDEDTDRKIINDCLSELGLDTRRFVDVENGKNHSDTTERQYHDEVSGNYGIMAGDGLVIVKIEDYEAADKLGVLGMFPETMTVKGPHGFISLFFHVEGNVIQRIEQKTGLSDLVILEWGQVLADNVYAMGPGSQLNASSCEKSGCDTCGLAGAGYYEVSHAPETPIATISTGTLIQAILAEFDSNNVDPLKFLI